MYAGKRRNRSFKRVREAPKPGAASNPSKRHRERLNAELETVASLLPYDSSVLSRLDKLSVLRLAVSFLQAKTHFQVSLQKHCIHHPYSYGSFILGSNSAQPSAPSPIDKLHASEQNIFKALGGFLLILNENGDIYYTSDNIETYLGFHQSDILHQTVFEMIHSEDREELRQQLSWTYSLPPTHTFQDIFASDGLLYLERSASARFRCLLDNTCGFLRIDIRGKLTILQGLPHCYLATRSDPTVPVLGLLAVCTPFVPPPNLDGPDTEPFLKTKHALDFSLFSLDAKARSLLEMDEKSLPISFYRLVHHQDAPCLGEAHREAVKNGASGLLVYRVLSRVTKKMYWLQSSCRLFYKNGKPESIGCTHRLLTEVEGETLLEKRASLSAKLLSFDDSLLQSPKLLQSTAALTTPSSAHKPKSRKFRPPTVSTAFRDPAVRSGLAFRAAAALGGGKGLFPAVHDDKSIAAISLGQNGRGLSGIPKLPSSSGSGWFQSKAPAHYYGYLTGPNDLYHSSSSTNFHQAYPTPAGYPLSPSKYFPQQTWPQQSHVIPAQDIPSEWTDLDASYSSRIRQQGTTDFPPPVFKNSRSLNTTETILPSLNFSISEVTNTLLGQ